MRIRLRTLLTVAFLASAASGFTAAGTASAQETRGTIFGTVRDTTGGVLPGMSVLVTNEDTNISHEATTNERGSSSSPTCCPDLTRWSSRAQASRSSRKRDFSSASIIESAST